MKNKSLRFTVLVCALGYFVDIYDLLLFGIVRVPSLRDLAVPPEALLGAGLHLLNMQMIGMLLGGIIWGILGDKRGRKSVLFGSILLYSLANIANAFVTDVDVYGWLRFIAGVGLAGELGAAVTLVSEIMSKESRGYGTAIVASVGILGAVVASLVGDFFSWKVAYIVGGVMGLALLALRASLMESGLFEKVRNLEIKKGEFLHLFTSKKRFKKYIACILIGVPIWFVIGILVTFSPELAKALGIETPISASKSIMWSYLGLSIGDLAAGFLSQYLKSRRKVVLIFATLTTASILGYVFGIAQTEASFYTLCGVLGFSAGYWAIFVTVAAEQFGTNLRATVATTVPNFVRGSVVLITLSFSFFKERYGILNGALTVGLISVALAFFALWMLEETFGKDLAYEESF
jgi:putative MFS transporter